jgi:hypothetical protein
MFEASDIQNARIIVQKIYALPKLPKKTDRRVVYLCEKFDSSSLAYRATYPSRLNLMNMMRIPTAKQQRAWEKQREEDRAWLKTLRVEIAPLLKIVADDIVTKLYKKSKKYSASHGCEVYEEVVARIDEALDTCIEDLAGGIEYLARKVGD